MLADCPMLGPQIRWTRRDPICLWETVKNTAYVQGPKDSYDLPNHTRDSECQLEDLTSRYELYPKEGSR
jgi:hypothetical protein